MFALKSLNFQHNTVYIESFRNFADIILSSAFLALYGLKETQKPMHFIKIYFVIVIVLSYSIEVNMLE